MRYLFLLACITAGWTSLAAAQQSDPPTSRGELRYAVSAIEDATFLGGRTIPERNFQNRVLLEPSFTYIYRSRWTIASKVVGQSRTDGDTHEQLLVRETYGALSAGAFDLTAGRRIVHWGVGYAFTAIGVLDPAIVATDPTDRLNLREGRDMAKLDWTAGSNSLSAAWATTALSGAQPAVSDTGVVRYNALVRGFDASLIAGKDRGGDPFSGVTFTRVLGQAWELHGEAAWREHEAVLVGGKFTTRSGITSIAELFTPPNIPYYRSITLSPVAGRQLYGFLRVGKSRLRDLPGWKQWDIYGSVVSNLNDHSYALVFDIQRRFGDHFSSYIHVEAPGGSRSSEYGPIPYASASSFGIRFQQ